ncbi:uncharacterized protein LOC133446912 [Cololabis saira]|uniref:uncharacterized protein LOC133446912 n=1 Tax=Cololabis saira TaxID=129043 RepID=UPI002AD2765B|nr:uncharacterized protein LOC133446912 [Cololabis saira]
MAEGEKMEGDRPLLTDSKISNQKIKRRKPDENESYPKKKREKIENECKNYNGSEVCYEIRLLWYEWDQSIKDGKELFQYFMENFSPKKSEHHFDALTTDLSPFKTYFELKKITSETQHAFSIILFEDGTVKCFPPVLPKFHDSKKKSDESCQTTKHSEEILLEQIDDFLDREGKIMDKILIYTYNSPCLQRKKGVEACTFQLLQKAIDWFEEDKCLTYVAFTKSWGFTGPNYIRNISPSDFSDPKSVFYPHVKRHEGISFKLDPTNFRRVLEKEELSKILSDIEKCDRKKLTSEIKSAQSKLVELAENSSGTRKDLLLQGKQLINSLNFPAKVCNNVRGIMHKKWEDSVEESHMAKVLQIITEEFNSAVVLRFREQLKENNSPLQLIPVDFIQLSDEFINTAKN